MEERYTLEFSDLPLIEVALKHVFAEPLSLSLPLVVELAKRLEGKFEVLDSPGYEPAPGKPVQRSFSSHETQGCRFVNSASGITVNVQQDMIACRWSRTKDAMYPRFPALQEAVRAVAGALAEASVKPVAISVVNIGYANRIPAVGDGGEFRPSIWALSEAWTPPEFKKHIPHSLDCSFRKDSVDMKYRFELQGGEEPWFLLVSIAGTFIQPGDDILQKEIDTHNALVTWFPELASNEALTFFGLKS